ncbi:MAG: hypothetical protein POH28_05050 [Acidocella sp.]|nr:hypothetical protein [Acidocella sp.]
MPFVTHKHHAQSLSAQMSGHDTTHACAAPDAALRAAMFESMSAPGAQAPAERLSTLLQSEQAAVRGAAIAALQLMGEDAREAVDAILSHPDVDLRLLGVEVMRAWPTRSAMPRLERLLNDDQHVNVCLAALDVAAVLGAPVLLPAMGRVRDRFSDNDILCFAEEQARFRILARRT